MGSRIPAASAALLLFVACAHRRIEPLPAHSPAAPRTAERPATVDPDADGDGLANAVDACPLEPGAAAADGCPQSYGSFFLRVLDADTRAPVNATLVFTPIVTRVIGEDDGFSGTLAPGGYAVTASAPGYAPGELRFEVLAGEKSTLVLTLQHGASARR